MLPVVMAAMSLIKSEEGCYLHAYPDPLSPLARAIGVAGVDHIGRTGEFPRDGLSGFNGEPWTIGWGTTGEGIRYGTTWTQAQCDAALLDRVQLAHRQASGIWPGLHLLHTNAQAALVSLVYNRGADLTDRGRQRDPLDRRLEMRDMVRQVHAKDYAGIAASIRSMKRLWPAKGLIRRRETEARMVESE